MKINIQDQKEILSKKLTSKQRQLYQYIISHAKDLPGMSIDALAEKTQVGRATVIRFVKAIGYESFQDLKHDINEYYLSGLAYPGGQVFHEYFGTGENNILSEDYEEGVSLLRQTYQLINKKDFEKSIALILNASRVNVMGFRTSKAFSCYFAYHLEPILPNVRDLSENESLAYDRVLQCRSDEVLIILTCSTPTRTSLRIASFCHEHHIPIILLGDYLKSKIIPLATVFHPLPPMDHVRFSALPLLSMIEAFIDVLSDRNSAVTIANYNKRDSWLIKEKIWED
ncbi:MAG: MurR/RpiR family transcriptional regulator [Lachnospiraceae bacterium]|nr:MurR/RpiR family transcriptional regulator [Lachnospiraceae bacterium]